MNSMTPRERMLASFAGQPVDCFPVFAPYLMHLHSDQWVKMTGQPPQTYYAWHLQEPEEHIRELERFYRLLPFDISQPDWVAGSRAERLRKQVVPQEDGESWYEFDPLTGERKKLVLNLHYKDQNTEWKRVVYSLKDADEHIPIKTAREILDEGRMDYVAAYVKAYGQTHYVAGTLGNSFYNSSWAFGLQNRFLVVHDEPELLHYAIERYHQQNIEYIRAMKAIGTDMVFLDDSTATKDMISIKMYREFCLPYMTRMVTEVQSLGMKAVLIYNGGIVDRVEDILSAGADGLLMETSMKGYINDLETIAAHVNNRLLLFGNLNPFYDIELKNDEELVEVMAKQIAIGKRYGRFVISTGSPLTPDTTLPRIQKFIELGHTLSVY